MTKKRRREQLENIIRLCQEGAADEVAIALNELDGPTVAIDPSNLQDVKSTAYETKTLGTQNRSFRRLA